MQAGLQRLPLSALCSDLPESFSCVFVLHTLCDQSPEGFTLAEEEEKSAFEMGIAAIISIFFAKGGDVLDSNQVHISFHLC